MQLVRLVRLVQLDYPGAKPIVYSRLKLVLRVPVDRCSMGLFGDVAIFSCEQPENVFLAIINPGKIIGWIKIQNFTRNI